ncbi:MAG: hypothetical protein QME58_11375 [Bacteroidota bacterium]|nr:hypothetical protein [Bacteroidota bacterium]
MIDQTMIPDIDPIALPAPIWLLKFLLLLTFTLHILAMNVAVGGGFVAAFSEYFGRKKKSQNHFELSRGIAKMLPPFTAFTITLGVAPLLFLQVLYGQFFYTSTILMAWPWLSVIIIFILAYYGYYIFSFHWEKLNGKRLWVVSISSILLATIGLIYVNNIVLMLTPDKWKAMYFANPHGTHLNYDDATIIPRYLHYMISAMAVAGVVVIMWGIRKLKTNDQLGKWAIRYGAWWFLIPTFINIAIGLWWLIALPRDFMLMFMGGNQLATGYFLAGLASIFVSIMLMFVGMNAAKPVGKLMAAKLFFLISIVTMILMRHELREAYLKPYINWDAVKTEPQWGVIIIFVLLLVGGLITVGWMVKKSFGKPALESK